MPTKLSLAIPAERRNADQVFFPSSKLPSGDLKRYATASVKGKNYRLIEEDEYPMGTPGWWALEIENSYGCGVCGEKAQTYKDAQGETYLLCEKHAKERGFERTNAGAWPMTMKCSFIEPGVVNYADVGMVLVRKDVLDRMANSFIGKPVVNEDHRSVSPEEFSKGSLQGIVNSVWFDQNDAMFHAAYQVWDQPTLKNIKQGYKVSCAYNVTRWGPGGIHNNVQYDREVLDGEYTHLAIVPNPRYEGVRIYNAKGAKTMTLKWIKKLLGTDGQEVENSVEIESAKSVIEVDGKDYTLDNAIEALKAQEAAKQAELENKGPSDDHIVEIPGLGKRTIKQLKEAVALKNAEDDDEEKKKKAKEEAEEKERKNAAAKAAQEKLENDLAAEHKDGKHTDSEKTNCGQCTSERRNSDRSHFERVGALAASRTGDDLENDIPVPYDGFAEGTKRFGSEPTAKK